MEDDLELRRYIRALLRRWWLFLLLAGVAGAAGYSYASLRTATYQATTLLAVSRPLFTLNLDEVNQNSVVPVRLYGELALSDEVVQTLYAQLQAAGLAPATPALLRVRLAANAATDTGLLRLTATSTTGAGAVQTANLWAEIILAQSVALYGPDSPQMVSYQAQLEAARTHLAEVDLARAEYQSQNDVASLEAALGSLKAQLAAALDRQTRYALLADDARSLLARLEAQDGAAPASTADEATLLLLAAQASNTGLPGPSSSAGSVQAGSGTSIDVIQQSPAPLQIQISIAGGVSSQTVNGLAAAVESFIADLATRTAAAGAEVEALAPQILELQEALAVAVSKAETYGTAVSLALSQYTSLAAMVDQAAIAAQDAAGLVRVASPATLPTLSGSSRRLTTAAVAAVVGLVLAVVIIVALEWWRTPLPAPRPAAAAPKDQAP